jgi:hypothetical protein
VNLQRIIHPHTPSLQFFQTLLIFLVNLQQKLMSSPSNSSDLIKKYAVQAITDEVKMIHDEIKESEEAKDETEVQLLKHDKKN